MTVYIKRKSDSSMTKIFRNGFDIITVFNADSGERMAKIMETKVRKSNSGNTFFKTSPHSINAFPFFMLRVTAGKAVFPSFFVFLCHVYNCCKIYQ